MLFPHARQGWAAGPLAAVQVDDECPECPRWVPAELPWSAFWVLTRAAAVPPPPPPADTGCLVLEHLGVSAGAERWEPPPAWVPRHILALGEVGPSLDWLPSHSQAAFSPAGAAGLSEPEGCRGRSVP